MAAATPKSVPHLDLTSDPKTLERGSEEWKAMSQRVREAMETYGGMVVDCSKINQEEMLKEMRSFFYGVPLEARKSQRASKNSYVYMDKTGTLPMFENIGIPNAANPENAKAFTDAVWPEGNQAFVETLSTTTKNMVEIAKIVLNMVCDSYEIELEAESLGVTEKAWVQLIRYAGPGNDTESLGGLPLHVDGSSLTVLFQNEVGGLKIQARNGEWHEVKLGGDSMMVFVGMALKAWSNCQFHAVPHKVEFEGNKDRFSFGVFLNPEDDTIVEAHPKFVNKHRPPLYKPFAYGGFIKYTTANGSRGDALDVYAPADATGNGTFES